MAVWGHGKLVICQGRLVGWVAGRSARNGRVAMLVGSLLVLPFATRLNNHHRLAVTHAHVDGRNVITQLGIVGVYRNGQEAMVVGTVCN